MRCRARKPLAAEKCSVTEFAIHIHNRDSHFILNRDSHSIRRLSHPYKQWCPCCRREGLTPESPVDREEGITYNNKAVCLQTANAHAIFWHHHEDKSLAIFRFPLCSGPGSPGRQRPRSFSGVASLREAVTAASNDSFGGSPVRGSRNGSALWWSNRSLGRGRGDLYSKQGESPGYIKY